MLLNWYKNKQKNWMDDKLFFLFTAKGFFVHGLDSRNRHVSELKNAAFGMYPHYFLLFCKFLGS